MAGLLLVLGVVGGWAFGTVMLVLVALALPPDGTLVRIAGGAAAALLTRIAPAGRPLLVASAEDLERGEAFVRVFVAGALLAEAAYVLWRARRPAGSG